MKPTIHLLVGRIGSGKTTYAKKLASESGAIRFTHDEWMHRLLGPTPPEEQYRALWNDVEDQIWQEAETAVRSGSDVILDFGYWTRESRDSARERAASIGGIAKLHYISCPRDIAFERTMQRSENPGAESLWIDGPAFNKLDALFEPMQSDEEYITVSEIEFSPNGLDHIIYACSDIEQGMDEIESLLGVRPVRGGSHAQFGTHNALLSLGPGIYLEVIARDPDLAEPDHGALIDFPETTMSRLVTWVYRTADIEDLATNSSLGVGDVDTGTRKNPDGSEIHWQLTNPYAMPMDGSVPFLINWGNTTHPSTVLPPGGQLTKVVIEHPDADRLRDVLSVLNSDVEVVAGDTFGISATIKTNNGPVVLT